MIKTLFVTVGSTGFDKLISLVTSSLFLKALYSKGYKRLKIQCGTSIKIYNEAIQCIQDIEMEIVGYDFKSSLKQDMIDSDLIISHAGSGSILESLRLQKPLIVVINETLMNNHQVELAIEMQNKGYLVCGSISNLLEIFRSDAFNSLTPFPEPDETIFADILNEEMML
ncbi:11778_t:CDS:2 [Acaulospora morrowiae]|uniref:UDP-N-acetylglucosamine transferase subunit ALG13 n=1 Tax=Acaulospora morrowiae TaxID=94023 RepID=A0A9N9HQ30_9GLOM|nr:11778_t:CDS:2 [Acaulospora morrowiae]